jgi:gas vesicle protein
MGKIKGFLAGGIIGAIAGLMLAPQKGEETRKTVTEESAKLKSKAQKFVEFLNTKKDEVTAKAKEIFGGK